MPSLVFIPCCATASPSARFGTLEYYYYVNWGVDGHPLYSQTLTLLSKEKKIYHVQGGHQRQRVVSVAMNGQEQLGNPG